MNNKDFKYKFQLKTGLLKYYWYNNENELQ